MSKSNSDGLRKFLSELYAYDQAGGYVPCELAPDDLKKLHNYIEAEYSKREQALADLIIGEDETYEGHQMVWSIEHRNQLRAEQRKRFSERTGDKT